MMPLQNTATVVVIKPQDFASAAATVQGYVDTLGFDECAIDVIQDSQAASSTNLAALTISEGETSTAFTAITGLTGDATDGFVIPATKTTPGVTRINVDLRGRMRYLSVDLTSGGDVSEICCVATLGKAGDSTVARAKTQMHGKTSLIRHDGRGVFAGLSNPLVATRYHSLAVLRETVPDDLELTATAEDGEIMGLRHRRYPVEGVQFHPESILTVEGKQLLKNFLTLGRP